MARYSLLQMYGINFEMRVCCGVSTPLFRAEKDTTIRGIYQRVITKHNANTNSISVKTRAPVITWTNAFHHPSTAHQVDTSSRVLVCIFSLNYTSQPSPHLSCYWLQHTVLTHLHWSKPRHIPCVGSIPTASAILSFVLQRGHTLSCTAAT
jgi:hypothetical protein